MNKALKIFLKLLLFPGVVALFLLAIPFSIMAYPLHMLNRPLCIRLSTFFTCALWTLISWVFNLSSTVDGNATLGGGDYFVISNHLGSVDFILINEIARKSNMIAHMKYAIKDGLKVFPVFYQVIVYVGFLVLRRSFESDRKKIVSYFEFFKRNSIPMWFILYPEGSRFTPELRARSWEYSDKMGMKRLSNVLFPRYKGFKLVCEQLRNSRIKYIADITFFYSDGEVPPLWKFLFWDTAGSFKYDVRIIPIDEIGDYEEFVYKAFERKDALIAEWKGSPKRK